MHIILYLHAFCLPVAVQCVTVMNMHYQRSELGDGSKTQQSTLRHSSSWLQK